jgi:dynein intermediate chain
LNDNNYSKSGVSERFDGHFGPITSMDFHPSQGSIDFSEYFLSSSTDWSVKLWNKKTAQQAVYSFEYTNDYVYDVKWCPTHPALFASGDGRGFLELWNLK